MRDTLPHGSADDASVDQPPQLSTATTTKSAGPLSIDGDDASTRRASGSTEISPPFLETHWLRGIGEG